jgi:hypothetical protein
MHVIITILRIRTLYSTLDHAFKLLSVCCVITSLLETSSNGCRFLSRGFRNSLLTSSIANLYSVTCSTNLFCLYHFGTNRVENIFPLLLYHCRVDNHRRGPRRKRHSVALHGPLRSNFCCIFAYLTVVS